MFAAPTPPLFPHARQQVITLLLGTSFLLFGGGALAHLRGTAVQPALPVQTTV